MMGRAPTLTRHHFTRQCVRCGYDGALLRGGQAERCARCGCDLRRRPARSYAEMEGLVGHPTPLRHASPAPMFPGEAPLIHKWLAFGFFATLTLIALGYLASSVLVL